MKLIHQDSLAQTLANLNDCLLRGQELTAAQREELTDWIASRAGVPGSYRGLPAPTALDYRSKLRLFTGENVNSRAGAGCKLGFEAAWALSRLRPRKKTTACIVRDSRLKAISFFVNEKARSMGMYCCFSCSVAGWRVLGIAGEPESRPPLEAAMALLKVSRDGKGRWNRFPFWYTVLALSEMTQQQARTELQYARPVLERAVKKPTKPELYIQRRIMLAHRVLERVA